MGTSAMAGTIGFGPQVDGDTAATTFYRHRATNVDIGNLDETRLGAPEVGGVPVPTFPYKAGYLVGGGMTIQPRLENTLGWLLYALMGKVTTTAAGTAAYQHVFNFDADPVAMKWLSFRKHIPRRNGLANTDLGQVFKHCKLTGIQFTLPNDAPISARVDAIGRDFELSHDPSAWTWANTFEQYNSIPVGCKTSGYINVNSVELPVVAAKVGFTNVPLDIRQERVYGSPLLDDITIVERMMMLDIIVKWNNPDLYTSILTGSPTGTSWVETPFVAPVDILMQAPGTMPAEAVPYSLRVQAPTVMLALQEDIALSGNQAVMMRFTGTVVEPPSGDYATFTLTNKQATYTWPTS